MDLRSPIGTLYQPSSCHFPSSFSPRSAHELQEPSSTFYTPQNAPALLARLDKLEADVRVELGAQGFDAAHVHTERMLNMRFEGTDTALMVLPAADERDAQGREDFARAFTRVYRAEFGFVLDTKSVIVDDVKVRLSLARYEYICLLT